MAHDMRAPLRAMGIFAQMSLEQAAAHGMSSEVQDYCQRIQTGQPP